MRDDGILVTGGAGFIGSHLVDLLLESGYTVYALDNLSTGKLENLEEAEGSPNFRFIRGDVTRSLSDVLGGSALGGGPPISAIFHLAARVDVTTSLERPLDDALTNYTGTINVLDYAIKNDIRWVTFSSSAAVYGDVRSLPVNEDDPLLPLSPYGLNKMASENLLRIYGENYNINTASLRFFNVYGPRQDPGNPYSGVISKFMEWGKNGQPLIIYGDGSQTRDFVYVKDVAAALHLAYRCGATGAFNIGTGTETSISRLAEEVSRISGNDLPKVHMEERKGEISRSQACVDKFERVCEFRPSTSLKQGLRETYRSI